MDTGSLAAFVAAHGYPAVAVIVGLESMGLPVPGETTLITAAIFAGSTHVLKIGPVIASAAAGAIAGDAAGYWIGRWLGHAVLLRFGSHLRLTPERLAIGQHLFERHGAKVVFLGRFIAVMRTVTALLAGINEMPWKRFLLFNAAGGFTWAAAIGIGAYLLGHRVEHIGGIIGMVALIGAVLAVIAVLVVSRHYESRLLVHARGSRPDEVGRGLNPATQSPGRHTDETHTRGMSADADGVQRPGAGTADRDDGRDKTGGLFGQGSRQGGW